MMRKKMITGNRARNSYIWQGLLLISVVLLSGCGGGGGSGSSSPAPSLVGTYTGVVISADGKSGNGDAAEYHFTVASDGTITGTAETSSSYPLTGMLTPGGALTLNVPLFFNITGQVHLVNGDVLNGTGKEFNVSDGSLYDTITFDLQRYSIP